jgi:hypothetical protein
MPTCNFVTYAMIDGDTVTPIPRVLDVDFYLDYIKNRTMPALNDDLLRSLEMLWSSSAQVGSDRDAAVVSGIAGGLNGANGKPDPGTVAAARCASCHSHLPLSAHAPRDLAKHVFMVNTRDFMDPWTFSVKNVMKCCVEFLTPDGRMIPFCAYNTVGYREQVSATLSLSNRMKK